MEKNLKRMYLISLLNEIKFYGIILILFYIQLSGSMTLGMSIFSIITIISAISELPTGIISDKIGRKNTVIIGSFCSLMSVICLASSTNYFGLIISAIFQGLETAFFSGNNSAYIYDILKEENKEEDFKTYIGKTNSMFYLARSNICNNRNSFSSYNFI